MMNLQVGFACEAFGQGRPQEARVVHEKYPDHVSQLLPGLPLPAPSLGTQRFWAAVTPVMVRANGSVGGTGGAHPRTRGAQRAGGAHALGGASAPNSPLWPGG